MTQPSDALTRYVQYVGWDFTGGAADYDRVTARLVGAQGPYKYAIAKRGACFRYAIFDEAGAPQRTIVFDGTRIASSRDGKRFSALPEDQAFLLRAEVAAFFTDFRGYTVGRSDAADPNRATLQSEAGSIDIDVDDAGACRCISLHTDKGTERLVPLQFTRLSAHHRIYATWRRNDEPPIRFERLEGRAKVYDGEVSLPESADLAGS